MRLNAFIESSLERLNNTGFPSNAYVEEPGWDALYVRLTRRVITGTMYKPVLDLAVLEVEEDLTNTGLFTKLVKTTRETWPDLHIYVETVLSKRFAKHLERSGYQNVTFQNYFLKALNFGDKKLAEHGDAHR